MYHCYLECCWDLLILLFYVVFKSFYQCINAILNAAESSKPFFFMSSYQCSLQVVLSMCQCYLQSCWVLLILFLLCRLQVVLSMYQCFIELCWVLLNILFYVVFKSSPQCINAILNVAETSESFFFLRSLPVVLSKYQCYLDCCWPLLILFVYVVFKSSYQCINAIFNAAEYS